MCNMVHVLSTLCCNNCFCFPRSIYNIIISIIYVLILDTDYNDSYVIKQPKPRIDYTLKAIGGSLTAIPGLSDMIDVSLAGMPFL